MRFGFGRLGAALMGFGALVALHGCGEIELTDGRYICDPLVADTCPPGMLCQWSMLHNGHRCFWRLLDDAAVVDGGRCGPENCDGCCDSNGNCHTGTEHEFCGLGGPSCENCSARSRTCERGVCRGDTCDCDSGGCCDGCYYQPASYHCGDGLQIAEYRCTGSGCGGVAERRELKYYCSGVEKECSDDNVRWTSWQTVEACDPDAVCQATGQRAWCATCPGGCQEGACQGCTDLDGDTTGPGCTTSDCDDLAPGVAGPCEIEGCPVDWIHVAAGIALRGCNDPDRTGICEEYAMPLHEVDLDAFCIEPLEVSVAAYRACVEAGVCSGTPTETTMDPLCNWSASPSSREHHPLNCVSWLEAREYCNLWLGATLPTEAQWEKAARGTDARSYPWGQEPEPDCLHANFDVSGTAPGVGCATALAGPGTWEVGHLSSGVGDSPYGCKDMVGNVWEWNLDCWSGDAYLSCQPSCANPVELSCTLGEPRVVRGGGFSAVLPRDLTTFKRFYSDPSQRQSAVGFRCVRVP